MTRSRIRRLRIADADFVCSVRASAAGVVPASVAFAAYAPGRRLRMRFSSAPAQGRLAGDAGLDHGSLRTADGRWINLHLPAVMQALVLAALGDGRGDDVERDGWRVLDAAALPVPAAAAP
ncbi:hypothetical protein [Stenotrophomonas sp. S41]|uniref:hypothetical protein n=1 Tax=Stenotrophomonas sp. S41 TaxID=2767464 RepID=UPI00190DA2A9|nr:hypothetical protein [Stenotrophomonas sp. S41]MBK0014482.1 hypothetical protein [Stenotrophomonas sp. S41]